MTQMLWGLEETAAALMGVGRWMGGRGFLPATSGNVSARLGPNKVLVTVSGCDKANLQRGDLIELDVERPDLRGASAETPLHLALYRWSSQVVAVLHGHSVASTVISRRRAAAGKITLSGYELAKAFDGVSTHDVTLDVPVLANGQDMQALAQELVGRLDADRLAPGFLLAGHGVYAWGPSIAAARRHLEALEFLFQCELHGAMSLS